MTNPTFEALRNCEIDAYFAGLIDALRLAFPEADQHDLAHRAYAVAEHSDFLSIDERLQGLKSATGEG